MHTHKKQLSSLQIQSGKLLYDHLGALPVIVCRLDTHTHIARLLRPINDIAIRSPVEAVARILTNWKLDENIFYYEWQDIK